MNTDLQNVLNNARKIGGKKVGLSVQISSHIKDDFECFCSDNGVSMSSMLESFIKVVVSEHNKNKVSKNAQ